MSEAQHKAQGIVGISLMVQIGETLTNELRMLTSTFNKVTYKGRQRGRKRKENNFYFVNFRMQIFALQPLS